jgi:anti-sigma factor RsiW
MRCEEAKEALVDLVFGDPDDETAAQLNEHLIGCLACRAEERELLSVRDRLGGEHEDEAASDELRERIRRALPRRRRGVGSILLHPIPAYAAAAACLFALFLARAVPPIEAPKEPAARPARVLVGPRAPDFVVAGSYETSVRRGGLEPEAVEPLPSDPLGDSL